MKKLALICSALAVLAMGSGAAAAAGYVGVGYSGGHGYYGNHGYYGPRYRSNFGISLGFPLFGWGPGYGYGGYYSPYYAPYYGTDYAPARVYVERSAPEYVDSGIRYRYYCSNPDGYFPAVRKCETRWQTEEAGYEPGQPSDPQTPPR